MYGLLQVFISVGQVQLPLCKSSICTKATPSLGAGRHSEKITETQRANH
ncbi:MAG: hypothetical protein K8953_01655 [Proteobacteria bacterium]|nr:hypothetical protein [Pseudomonadota bacterium]